MTGMVGKFDLHSGQAERRDTHHFLQLILDGKCSVHDTNRHRGNTSMASTFRSTRSAVVSPIFPKSIRKRRKWDHWDAVSPPMLSAPILSRSPSRYDPNRHGCGKGPDAVQNGPSWLLLRISGDECRCQADRSEQFLGKTSEEEARLDLRRSDRSKVVSRSSMGTNCHCPFSWLFPPWPVFFRRIWNRVKSKSVLWPKRTWNFGQWFLFSTTDVSMAKRFFPRVLPETEVEQHLTRIAEKE